MTAIQEAVRRTVHGTPFAREYVARADDDSKLDRLLAGLERLTSRMDAMEEKIKPTSPPPAKADAEGEPEYHAKLDQILDHLGDLHSKHDALADAHEEMKKRLDACETGGKAAPEALADADEEENLKDAGEPAPTVADADEPSPEDEHPENDGAYDSVGAGREPGGTEQSEAANRWMEDHGAKGDSEDNDGDSDADDEGALDEEREENDLSRNDSRRNSRADATMRKMSTELAATRKALADLQRRVPMELPEDRLAQYASAQALASPVYHAFGDANGAPHWMNGETLRQYRRRLVRKYQSHSPAWKGVDLSKITDDTALGVAENQIYADAAKAARTDVGDVPGRLRHSVRKDITGRHITEFFGDPQAWLAPFRANVHYVTGVRSRFSEA